MNPNVLFGLALTHDEDLMTFAFNLDILDNIVDVYYAKTYDYYTCYHRNRQAKMVNTSPIKNMETTIHIMKKLKYPMSKIIIDIQVLVISVKKFLLRKSKYDYFSYSKTCSLEKPDPNRKYCEENLAAFYHKGVLVHKNAMAGVLIHSIDYDDYKDSCKCHGNWPVFKCISAGVIGAPDPLNVSTCVNFGKIIRDQWDDV